jgi:AAA+ ATPase superfamily predicted ATPase
VFVDRQVELSFLNQLLTRKRPGPAQLVLLYGRRRVGKTALLKHWAEQSGVPCVYWVATKEPPAVQRRSLTARLMDVPGEHAPLFESWSDLWNWFAPQAARSEEKRILILDEFQYASEADPAMLSALQHAWDQYLQASNLIIVLCGSQVRTMETIMHYQSPLFGRFTGQWLLQPLPFSALENFFPNWSPAERVALFAIVGGVPAYLTWLDPGQTLSENIRDVILAPGSMFMAEPSLLLYDELRELSSYIAILRAISNGYHTLGEISNAALIGRTSLSAFLGRLQELRFVERRIPVTLTTAQRHRSRRGRYHLCDPYFRFYFRFVGPHQESLLSSEQTLKHIQRELRSFVGLAFEELARQWVAQQARSGALPFVPEAVGAHWSRRVQVDVVAINHESRDILLGECKWGTDQVSRQVVRNLIEKSGPQVRKDLSDEGQEWALHYTVFARSGFSDAAIAELEAHGGRHVDLEELDEGLSA